MARCAQRSVDPNYLGGLQRIRANQDKRTYSNEHVEDPGSAIANTRFAISQTLLRYVIAIAIDAQLNSP